MKQNTAQTSLVHPYHLVDVSPWPILMSFAFLLFALSLVAGFVPNVKTNTFALIASPLLILLILVQWFRDIIREARGGYHTTRVQKGILISFELFLVTEVMLFFSFFWAFFHSSLAPAVELGCQWPPMGINPVNTWSLPLFGTCLLLSSGMILTLGHHALIRGQANLAILGMLGSVVLGALFAFAQFGEYCFAEFTIADSVFGSIFYMTTGLHFFHVVAGVLFLLVGMVRLMLDQVTSEHHMGIEFAIYYWHLVDVVWLAVYVLYYWWGGA
jgi:cytochrome c oxidase subunit 3